MRLDRVLTHCLCGSRTECRGRILLGRVCVNGQIARVPSAHIDPDSEICLDGERVYYKPHRYVMLHKPAGYLSATRDARSATVLDLLPENYRRLSLAPVGRLDADTTGLLLLTDDGALAHRLLSPRAHVPKVYEARVDGALTAEMARRFGEGLPLSDMVCLPAKLEILEADFARITLYEGKFHQVKRMLTACGLATLSLKRIRMGPLALDEALAPGRWRELTDEEETLLQST